MEPNEIPGAPELNKHKKAVPVQETSTTPVEEPAGPRPQLIRSTPMAARVTVEREQPNEDEDDWQEPDRLNDHVEEPGDPDGVIAKEEWQRHQRELDAQRPVNKKDHKKKKRGSKRPWILFIIFLLVAGAGAYIFLTHKQLGTTTKPATQPVTQKPASSPTTQTQTSDKPVATKSYTSESLMIAFKYPETWKLTDAANKVTVVSPSLQLTGADGQKVSGHVIVTMQNKQTTIAGYPTAGATAVQDSDHLTYSQPSQIQRAQTYLSYLGYTTSTALNAMYITGDNGYQSGQQVPLSDVITGDPLVSVTFATCTADDCSTPTAISLLASTWKQSTNNTTVKDLIASLQLQ